MLLDLSMLYLTFPLVAGILLGHFLRGRKQVNLNKVTYGIIGVLIFSLGFSIGSNNDLLASMPRVGLSAFVMSVLAIAFSVLFVTLITRRMKME
jgi:hypothetical protein